MNNMSKIKDPIIGPIYRKIYQTTYRLKRRKYINEYNRIYMSETRVIKSYYCKFKRWLIKWRRVYESEVFNRKDYAYIRKMNQKL